VADDLTAGGGVSMAILGRVLAKFGKLLLGLGRCGSTGMLPCAPPPLFGQLVIMGKDLP
jgi:hypothetical protein